MCRNNIFYQTIDGYDHSLEKLDREEVGAIFPMTSTYRVTPASLTAVSLLGDMCRVGMELTLAV